MGDPTGHFFHDMIEGVVIWEDGAKGAGSAPIDVPAEAGPLPETHAGHDHIDALPDSHDHTLPDVDVYVAHAGENNSMVAADHSHDGTVADTAPPTDVSHDGDASA